MQRATTTTQVSTTTTSKPTTITTPAAGAFSLFPTAGPAGTQVMASGAGCVGTDGVSLEIRDSAGRAIDGNGGAAMPDGTWQIPLRFPNAAPGRYTVHAACVTGSTVVFQYVDAAFDLG
jgi:hypothetical protein